MSNIFQNLQLQRIADAIENGDAGGGTLTINLTGVGDMQPATASTAGAHGLVPAPQAGDNDKVLSGAGTWIHAGAGVDYSLTEQDTGLKWIDGRTIYQKTIDFGSMPVGQEKDVLHGITDLAFVVDLEFIVYNVNNVQWRLMPAISRGNVTAQSVYGVDSQYIFVLGGQNADIDTSWNGIATIRYTKTV